MFNSELINEIENISFKKSLSDEDMRVLTDDIQKLKTQANDRQLTELYDLLPALKKYIEDHNAVNLHKLCVEIVEFCRAVYASTTNDEERTVYDNMISKLNKK